MIPPTFVHQTTVAAGVRERLYAFQVGAAPTEHVHDGKRIWNLAIGLGRRLRFTDVMLDETAENPTPDDLAHMLDDALVDSVKADTDPVTYMYRRGLTQEEALAEIADARRAAAVFEFLGISSAEALHVAAAVDPKTVTPAFEVVS